MNKYAKKAIEAKQIFFMCVECGMKSYYEYGIKKAGCEHMVSDLRDVEIDEEEDSK